MTDQLLFGIQPNGIRNKDTDPVPDLENKFRMVRDSGLYDYIDYTPQPAELDDYANLSEKYQIPVLAGGWFYTLGEEMDLFEQNMKIAQKLGSKIHNVQIKRIHRDGHVCTLEDLATAHERLTELATRFDCSLCWETHIDMWSEDIPLVSQLGRLVESRGLEFNITLDHSHVIFKIDNPDELSLFDLGNKIERGELVIDPFSPGNVIAEWINAGWVRHCHARPVIPNNPKNITGRHPDGRVGRGIQYPFVAPSDGTYHAEWNEARLEPWKEGIRLLLDQRASDPRCKLKLISTEFIPNTDYGEGCQYSLFEQSLACVQWLRNEWDNAIKKSKQPNSA